MEISRPLPVASSRVSTAACGKRTLSSVSPSTVVDTMKNKTSTRSTSTSEMTLISGSSLERLLCSFIADSKHARALVLQQRLDEADRFLLDLDDEAVHAAAQEAVGNQ